MAKWAWPSAMAALSDKYNQLLKEHEELKKNISCDYYEAYLLEKKKRENLETKLNQRANIKVEDVNMIAGWEYFDDK